MKAIIGISRFIVGVLFIFSGLIKANDPLGLSYKMQEFFEVWNMQQFNGYRDRRGRSRVARVENAIIQLAATVADTVLYIPHRLCIVLR